MTKKIVSVPEHKTINFIPDIPSPDFSKIYAKSDGRWYRLDDQGNEFPLSSVDISINGSTILNGPFANLNLQPIGSGITGSGTNTSNVDLEIITAGLVKIYHSNFLAKKTNSELKAGAKYWIVDVGDGESSGVPDCAAGYYGLSGQAFDQYPHNAGIIVAAVSANEVDPNAIMLSRVPFRAPGTFPPNTFISGTFYSIGGFIENYNEVYELIGPSGNYTIDPADDPTNWRFVKKNNTTHYASEIHGCIYDVDLNIIKERWDHRGNRLKNTYPHAYLGPNLKSNELIKKCFLWGYDLFFDNTIHLYDDTEKNGAISNKRIPNFNPSGVPAFGLVNYTEFIFFCKNEIDVDSLDDPTFFGLAAPTRVFKNNLALVFGSLIMGNKIKNSVISNIPNFPIAFTLIDNEIEGSVINNFSGNLNKNTIKNTVLGDIYYYYTIGSNEWVDSNYSRLTTNDLAKIENNAILYNLGSKAWGVSGAQCNITVGVGETTISFLNGVTPVPTYAAIGDLVYFGLGSSQFIYQYYRIIDCPTDNGGTLSANQIKIADDSGINAVGVTLNSIVHHASIPTCFGGFTGSVSRNTITRTVIRGINKDTPPTCFFFDDNVIDKSYFENVYPRVTGYPSLYGGSQFAYSDPGLEYGSTILHTTRVGFCRNRISDSIFRSNKIRCFHDNTISGAGFYGNAPDPSDPSTSARGLNGFFHSNIISGDAAYRNSGYAQWYLTADSGQSFGPSVLFLNNAFDTDSYFSSNVVSNRNTVNGTVLESQAIVFGCNFSAVSGRREISGAPSSYSIYGGLIGVTVLSGVRLGHLSLTGNDCFFSGVKFDTSLVKEVGYAGPAAPNTVDQLTIRDTFVSGTGYSSNDVLSPVLFSTNTVPVRRVEVVSIGPPTPTVLGTKTFLTSSWTLEIETHQPHMLNLLDPNYDSILFFLEGFPVNTVAEEPYPPVIPPTPPNPDQSFYFKNGDPLFNYNGFSFTGAVVTVIDPYVIQCTVTGTGGYYLLHPTNSTIADFDKGYGINPPGPGIDDSNPFNDTQRDYIALTGWYYSRYSALSWPANSAQGAFSSPDRSEVFTRIALGLGVGAPPAPPTGSRDYFHYANADNTAFLYNETTTTLTLPVYIEQLNPMVIFGSHVAGSGPGGSYEIDKIVVQSTHSREGLIYRFTSTPGCKVRFNLTAASSANIGNIIRDGVATHYTITAHAVTNSVVIYDEIWLQYRNGLFTVIKTSIHA